MSTTKNASLILPSRSSRKTKVPEAPGLMKSEDLRQTFHGPVASDHAIGAGGRAGGVAPSAHPVQHGHAPHARNGLPRGVNNLSLVGRALEDACVLATVRPKQSSSDVDVQIPVFRMAAEVQKTAYPFVRPAFRERKPFVAVLGVHFPRQQQLAMVAHARDALRLGFGPSKLTMEDRYNSSSSP